jgi:transposase
MSPLAPLSGPQGLLGVSKRHPHLGTLVRPGDPEWVDVLFGSECLASYRRDDLGSRNALVGMLASAGVRLADVARLFAVDPRQARRYARRYEAVGLAALAAEGPGRPPKVTPEIEAFVRAAYRERVLRQGSRGLRAELREGVEREFGVRLGPERLRQITAPVRAELRAAKARKAEEAGPAEPAAVVPAERPVELAPLGWEKHDRTDYSRYEIAWHPFEVELQGNDEDPPRVKKLWVADCPRDVQVGAWGPKSPLRHHRKMLVRAELKGRGGALKGHRIAPFLSNDPASSAETLARKLLRRWRETKAKADALRADLDALEAKRRAEPERINQLRYLREEGYERPDFSRKLLIDLLKIAARNARREAESVLGLYYRNRRDHVTLLRRMLRAGGTVRLDAQGVLRVHLDRLNTAAEDEAFTAFLADLNARQPRTLGPAALPLLFDLRRNS